MSCQTLNSGSNDLKEDRVLSNQSDRLSNSDDSNSENEDEIFLVFRGKPNNRQSTFDEGQAAAGKETDMIEWSSHMIIMYQSIRSLKLYPSSPTGNPPPPSILTFDDWFIQVPVPGVKIENSVGMPYVSVGFDDQLFFEKEKLATITFL